MTRADRCACVASGELGIALSGGGARALAQLGVLKVLDRERITVSYVAGTSGGAVIGAVYATSATAIEAEERILTHLATTGVGFNTETFEALAASNARRPTGFFGMLGTLRRAARPGGGLIGGETMRASLSGLLGETTFADTRMRLAATALDLVTGRRVIFAEGSLVDAVYASSAIPGLFEPLHIRDHVLVDGGWAEPVPVSTAHHLGAIHVVAVEVAERQMHDPARGAISTALLADALARHLLEEEQLRAADFVVRPEAQVKHFADFSDPAALIAAGERAAEETLPQIVAVLERHRVVLTGGPGAGKTAVLELIRQSFCVHVVVLPESAGIVFGGGFPRGEGAELRQAAQRAIFYVQRELEAACDSENPAIVLCDRGTVDGSAYWPGPNDLWFSVGTTLEEQLRRYDAVIHLRTPAAATGYGHQNPLRIESAAEAVAIDARIAHVGRAPAAVRRGSVTRLPRQGGSGDRDPASRDAGLLPAPCRPTR